MTMKTTNQTIVKQWSIMTALMVWGFVSFLVLCGDDTPNNPMSMSVFLITKGTAMLSLWLCIKTGKALDRKGMLPNINDEEGAKL